MKLKLLALLTILLLASMSCKKKDDDTSPTAPKTTLAEREGVYTGSVVLGGGAITYNTRVEVKNTGKILAGYNQNILTDLATHGFNTTDTFLPTTTDTSFNITAETGSITFTIVFTSKTILTLKDTKNNIDLGTLTKQ